MFNKSGGVIITFIVTFVPCMANHHTFDINDITNQKKLKT